jgi:transposase
MDLFVGLDVSLNSVSVCIVEGDGTLVWQGKTLCEPPSLLKVMQPYRDRIKLVGLEACPLSEWLYGGLSESGLPTVCVEVRHAHRFLSKRLNKTDRNDARGIAEMIAGGPLQARARQEQSVAVAAHHIGCTQEVRRPHATFRLRFRAMLCAFC